MQSAQMKKINVVVVFAGFPTDRYQRKITPCRFMLPGGQQHEVAEVRRVYTDRPGNTLCIHFVVKTPEERFFDLVYDTGKTLWHMVVEA